VAFTTSLFIASLSGFLSPDYTVIPDNFLHNEYDWSYNILGAICIWSTIASCLFGACYIERKDWDIEIPIINTIGVQSLWYFFFHRIFFIFLFFPLRVVWANLTGFEIQNTLLSHLIAICIYTTLFFSFKAIRKN
jgi:hypothetical protein